ncbi:VOC family protein [Halomonas heilongjiangensis]|uniref:VOC family protein n=1 Tax=Halomonas heilongjiangensis TaxID=1387883 RepID=UPI001F0BE729|nr:VOC family protein [Halomonas heilongjiangensis]
MAHHVTTHLMFDETAESGTAEEAKVLVPPDDYGFSTRFTWLNDRFGVSWQLNLT